MTILKLLLLARRASTFEKQTTDHHDCEGGPEGKVNLWVVNRGHHVVHKQHQNPREERRETKPDRDTKNENENDLHDFSFCWGWGEFVFT